MNELVDSSPRIEVKPAEYHRLLGYPRDHQLSDRAEKLADWARTWYAANGSPWMYARQAERLEMTNGSISIDGVPFVSKGLQSALHLAGADGLFLVAVSAGPELEHEAQRLWLDEKPDEYFFLEVYGSAVVEHLVTMCGARLCAWAEPRRMAVLPHVSPGYPDWDVSQQADLLHLICRRRPCTLPGALGVLPSGMLRPKKSLLAVFGLTRQTARVRALSELNPCESCSFQPCQYRRAPYHRASQYSMADVVVQTRPPLPLATPVSLALDHDASYAVNAKALARWSADRLTLTPHEDGTTEAVFRYEGTTCTNLGRRLLFDYHVQLGPADLGYPIQSQKCVPAPGDDGYRSMCQYLDSGDSLMLVIGRERPLSGQPLNSVVTWERHSSCAGCYCELGDRMHKWRLVLETIHYALVQHERRQTQPARMAAVP